MGNLDRKKETHGVKIGLSFYVRTDSGKKEKDHEKKTL